MAKQFYAVGNLRYGVGRTDAPTKDPTTGALLQAYNHWRSLLRQCYDKAHKAAEAEVEAIVDERWHSLSAFTAWHNKHCIPGYVINSSILSGALLTYGPDTCLFIPPYLHRVVRRPTLRGELPPGTARVTTGNLYRAQIITGVGKQTVGYYKSVDEAAAACRKARRDAILAASEQCFQNMEINNNVCVLVRRRIEKILDYAGADRKRAPVKLKPTTDTLCYGVGHTDMKVASTDRSQSCAYEAWKSMLQRCYDLNWQGQRSTYTGCSVDPAWHKLSAFAAWYTARYRRGYALDKDVLKPGNKVYGPQTCLLIPQRINTLLIGCDAARGAHSQGVSMQPRTGSYLARVHCATGYKHLGTYATEALASAAYWTAKLAYVRDVVDKALKADEIDSRTHAAVLRYARYRKRLDQAKGGACT